MVISKSSKVEESTSPDWTHPYLSLSHLKHNKIQMTIFIMEGAVHATALDLGGLRPFTPVLDKWFFKKDYADKKATIQAAKEWLEKQVIIKSDT